ncbi:MAG TPA: HD domain-containing phosphohydrolase [Oxalicibacterium sp.]|jgi:response regulator RpfG family c-di-GMP phosphodiesterase|nr:HD domain-containing phosphohydrolase [Oxalicibacterium sp.]
MEEGASTLRVFDAVKALAFVGDLSMGQPTDHSLRTAWLANRLAVAAGLPSEDVAMAREAALLRWSGCTANAPGFADLFGDDVIGRQSMLAMRSEWMQAVEEAGGLEAVSPLARIHCEVAGEVARALGLGATEKTLRHIFEAYNGQGVPDGLAGNEVPPAVFVIAIAGDIEILSRTYGLERASELIRMKADAQYPSALVSLATAQCRDWLDVLDREGDAEMEATLLTERMANVTAAELIADVVDLKLPWMTGFSRRVAQSAARCCAQLGMDDAHQRRVYQAGLIHGVGRAAVPNALWASAAPLPASAWEQLRLVPYWTARAGKQIAGLSEAAEIASYAYERLDGSGYFRSVAAAAIPREAHVLGIAIMWEALQSRRPWRDAYGAKEAAAQLRHEAQQGRVNPAIVEQIVAGATHTEPSRRKAVESALSPREAEVLRHISLGASNKETARALGLSPSTVATHVENVFRKLGCSTRAAATLKASTLGLL